MSPPDFLEMGVWTLNKRVISRTQRKQLLRTESIITAKVIEGLPHAGYHAQCFPIISQSPFIDKHYQSSENLRLFPGQTASGGQNQDPNPALSLIPPKARVLASR